MENKEIKIVLATGNPNKLKEIEEIISLPGIKFILPPKEFNPVEDGMSFEQNSEIKAKEASKVSHTISLADDSGLCVEALNGEPGIYSARYDSTPQKRIDKLLSNLTQSANRKAKFVCVMTLTDEDGKILNQTKGECRGEIALKQSGANGFGYDPIFIPDGFGGKTLADLPEEVKNTISHRAKALGQMVEYIKENLL